MAFKCRAHPLSAYSNDSNGSFCFPPSLLAFNSLFNTRFKIVNQSLLLRTEVNKVLELARTEKLIGSSLEAKVYIHTSDASFGTRLLQMCEAENDADSLDRIFITSQAEVISSLESLPSGKITHSGEYAIQGDNKVWIGVSRAEGAKCERCWNYSNKVGSFAAHPTLCGRCYTVVGAQPIPQLAAVS